MKANRIKSWHIFAAMVGAPAMFVGWASSGQHMTLPIVVASLGVVLVAWFASRIVPLPVAAGLAVIGIALFVMRGRRVVAGNEARWAAERQTAQMTEICDGAPITGTPNGHGIRIVHRDVERSKYWLDRSSWPVGVVPELVLCVDDSYEKVSAGQYTREGRSDSFEIASYRRIANVALRRVPTGEVAFSKRYAGPAPQGLPSVVTQNTRLTGDEIGYQQMRADFAHLLAPTTTSAR
jgi:hypothetical protein